MSPSDCGLKSKEATLPSPSNTQIPTTSPSISQLGKWMWPSCSTSREKSNPDPACGRERRLHN